MASSLNGALLQRQGPDSDLGPGMRTTALASSLSKLIDASLIALCLALPTLIWTGTWKAPDVVALLFSILAYSSFSGIAGVYRRWHGQALHSRLSRVLMAWGATVFVMITTAFLTGTIHEFSRAAIIVWAFATAAALTGWRIPAHALFIHLLERDEFKRRVIVWGRGETADRLIQSIRETPHLGLVLVDHIAISERDSDRRDGDWSGTQAAGVPAAPTDPVFERLMERAWRGEFNVLYIARQGFSSERLSAFVERLSDTAVSVYLAPDFSTIDLFQGHWSSLDGIPLISVFETPFLGVDGNLKRLEDVCLTIPILILAAVPMLLIALIIKLTSGGPVLFRQHRYGLGGQPIEVLKFRTMTVQENGQTVVQARPGDPRVTRFGRLLRRTSLDELPQFINVLRGEMSIVGPRPHAIAHDEIYRHLVKGYMLRRKVKPGITGWAQINGWRGLTDDIQKMKKRVEFDFWYIRHWSLWLDLKIILLTIPRMLKGENAY